MPRFLDLNYPGLKALQDAQVNSPKYKVEIKPSESSSDEEYVDITNIVISGSIERNMEGEPNTAELKIVSTEGEYDICNLNSVNNRIFKDRAKVKIYLGFNDPSETVVETFVLIFTGYVIDGYEQVYKRKDEEVVTIKLQDRTCFLDQPITTEIYQNMSLQDILEDILINYGGLDSGDIGFTNFDSYTIPQAQFIDETIWDMMNMASQVAMVIPYFNGKGVLNIQNIPTTLEDKYYVFPELQYETIGTSGTPTIQIEHYWDTSELRSQIITLGAIKENAQTGANVPVVDVDPNYSGFARGVAAQFESRTNGTGNPTYDSFYGDPLVDDNYGPGFQGTIIPYIYYGYDGEITPEEWGEIISARYNEDNWGIVVQGPFPWTSFESAFGYPGKDFGCYPSEPYQTIKTGIHDNQGSTGYFPTYNSHGGTQIQIDVSTLTEVWTKCYQPVQDMFEFFGGFDDMDYRRWLADIDVGILPSREDWEQDVQSWTGIEYPIDGDHGPTSTEFYVYCITFMAQRGQDPLENYWYYRVFPWGGEWRAGEIFPETRYTGTANDAELDLYYGESRYEEIENNLMFSDPICASLATAMLNNIKIFYVQSRISKVLNLEIIEGDNTTYYNPRTDCIEKACITSIKYEFNGKNQKHTMELRGGIIDVDGTAIEAWT